MAFVLVVATAGPAAALATEATEDGVRLVRVDTDELRRQLALGVVSTLSHPNPAVDADDQARAALTLQGWIDRRSDPPSALDLSRDAALWAAGLPIEAVARPRAQEISGGVEPLLAGPVDRAVVRVGDEIVVVDTVHRSDSFGMAAWSLPAASGEGPLQFLTLTEFSWADREPGSREVTLVVTHQDGQQDVRQFGVSTTTCQYTCALLGFAWSAVFVVACAFLPSPLNVACGVAGAAAATAITLACTSAICDNQAVVTESTFTLKIDPLRSECPSTGLCLLYATIVELRTRALDSTSTGCGSVYPRYRTFWVFSGSTSGVGPAWTTASAYCTSSVTNFSVPGCCAVDAFTYELHDLVFSLGTPTPPYTQACTVQTVTEPDRFVADVDGNADSHTMPHPPQSGSVCLV